jgi:hypothetical protein
MNKLIRKKNIYLPANGNQETIFFTKGKLRIAQGYEKIVFQKKPRVQFLLKNIVLENLYIPFYAQWMEQRKESLFIEYRTKDYCRLKVLYYKETQRFFCELSGVCTRTIL